MPSLVSFLQKQESRATLLDSHPVLCYGVGMTKLEMTQNYLTFLTIDKNFLVLVFISPDKIPDATATASALLLNTSETLSIVIPPMATTGILICFLTSIKDFVP